MAGHDDLLITLMGRGIALDLLLRAVYEERAEQDPSPQAFLRNRIEAIIGSADAVSEAPRSEPERRVLEAVETELRAFFENVSLRLRSENS